MNKNLFLELAKEAEQQLLNQNIKKALGKMESMLYLCPDPRLEDELNSLSYAFEGMLNCVRRGFKDDKRVASFQQMLEQSWTMYWNIIRKFKLTQSEGAYRKAFSQNLAEFPYRTYIEHLEKFPSNISLKDEHESFTIQLFNQIWTSIALKAEEVLELESLFTNEKILIEDRLMAISALMLSAIDFPDKHKIAILHHLCESPVTEIQVRAWVAMVVLCFTLNRYGIFSKEFSDFGKTIQLEENQEKLCSILRCFYESKNTIKLTQQLNERLMPELRKQQDINKKLMFDISIDVNEESHKLHKEMEKSAVIMDKLSKSGKDIYFGTFCHFKSFEFFRTVANWFYPFCSLHSATKDTFEKKKGLLDAFMEICPFCDSDKWSVFLIFQKSDAKFVVPEGVELRQPGHIKKDWKTYCNYYIQDLYRFYQLSTFRFEFNNPFKSQMDPTQYPFFMGSLDNEHKMKIAKMLINHDEAQSAVDIIEHLPHNKKEDLATLAYGYMQLEQYAKAVTLYQKCDIEDNDIKNKKYLATCYKKLGKWQKAAILLEELASQDSKLELKHLMHSAQCLIQGQKYKDALKLLYKIEYLQSQHTQALRAIVWCNFKIKQPLKALNSWMKIKKKNEEDWLNGGHIYWALNEEDKAYNCYHQFFEESEDKEKAASIFMEDAKNLSLYQINEMDALLMLQALGY